MPRWDVGHFDSSESRCFLEQVVEHFATQLDGMFAEGGDAHPCALGEAVLMPSVALLLHLIESFGARPPFASRVQSWRDQYLRLWQSCSPEQLELGPELWLRRQQVIEQSFARLLYLCERHEQSLD